MHQKGRRASLDYAQGKESSPPSQVFSPQSRSDTKAPFALMRLKLPQPFRPSLSLPKLSLKPRLSMKTLSAMDDVCTDKPQQYENCLRLSTTIAGKEVNSSICEKYNFAWKSTEEELDVLAAHVRPRRSRMSFCVSSTIGQQPVTPEKAKEPKMFQLIPWQDPLKKEAKAPSPACYLNLPKLPFGRHKSYNDIKDIRGLIVSRKEKARRRRKRLKNYDDDFDS